jgi:hypothetical protein
LHLDVGDRLDVCGPPAGVADGVMRRSRSVTRRPSSSPSGEVSLDGEAAARVLRLAIADEGVEAAEEAVSRRGPRFAVRARGENACAAVLLSMVDALLPVCRKDLHGRSSTAMRVTTLSYCSPCSGTEQVSRWPPPPHRRAPVGEVGETSQSSERRGGERAADCKSVETGNGTVYAR